MNDGLHISGLDDEATPHATTTHEPKTRDYGEEMLALARDALSQGDKVDYRGIARTIVKELHANDKDLLDGFLQLNAENFIYDLLRRVAETQRNGYRETPVAAKRRAAGEATQSPEAARKWLDKLYEVSDGVSKRLGKMTESDCGRVAANYAARESSNRIRKVFFEQLREHIHAKGGGTVESHFTDAQIDSLINAIS